VRLDQQALQVACHFVAARKQRREMVAEYARHIHFLQNRREYVTAGFLKALNSMLANVDGDVLLTAGKNVFVCVNEKYCDYECLIRLEDAHVQEGFHRLKFDRFGFGGDAVWYTEVFHLIAEQLCDAVIEEGIMLFGDPDDDG
jgi:hypothetical protein